MPGIGALKHQAEELRAQIKSVMADDTLTTAQRTEKLDKIEPEFETVSKGIAAYGRAAAMDAGLGAPQVSETDDEIGSLTAPNLGQSCKSLSRQILRSEGYRRALRGVGGREASDMKSSFNEQFHIDLKDSTAGGNQMGEGLYGGAGPTALGQNPFLSGAFGPGILPQFLPGIVEQRFYPLTIADLISSFTTGATDALSYLTESLAVWNAAATPEGGQYPFSSEEFSRMYEQIGKISNAATITDEGLRDAPQLASFVEGRIIAGIQRQEEVQLLAGAGGTAGGINGLLNRQAGFTKGQAGLTALTNVAFPTVGTPGAGASSATVTSLTPGRATGATPSGAAIGEAALEAVTDLRTIAFVEPNAIVMNPLDFQTVRLAKDNNGQYYGGSFFGADYGYSANGGQTLWGKRVVITPVMPQGLMLVGCFDDTCLQVGRRSGIEVQMTNTNVDNFVKGMVTIRAEERLGLLVYRPSAFELVALGVG